MDDLLKGILSGAAAQQDGEQTGGGELGDLLGGILGGSAAQGTGDAGDVLGELLGGQQGGGLGDVLNMFMGGGGANLGASPMLAPIVNEVAEKLGLPPAQVQMIVTFVVGKLLSARPGAGTVPSRGAGVTSPGSLDLHDLFERMTTGKDIDSAYLESTGMVAELSEQAGIDSDTAAQGLQQVLLTMGGQTGAAQRGQTGEGGLDGLLDTWQAD